MIESIHFAANEEVILEDRLRALASMGYDRQDQVDRPATFTHRGGVLDVFPWGFSFPVRINFFDNVVESIHSYDSDSGSLLEPHNIVVLLPVTERISPKKLKPIQWQWGEKPIQPFVDIEVGDHAVHVFHGIGIFRGTCELEIGNPSQKVPHLIVEYQDREKLYVPYKDINLLQRYIAPGQKKSAIKLSKLGSKMWIKTSERARKAIVSYAKELLHMQAQRALMPGHVFEMESDWLRAVASSFPYTETADQSKAIQDVLRDMELSKPMDRLICGDVGYGKTEVAIRAVFACAMNGKQSAILVPTTLLAEQHYENIKERFSPYPIQVEMISRFQTKKEQGLIVDRILNGETDVIIGTHRLLSKDVSFKDLGLIVVDEEQRFGVRHKERLKQFRLMVDVLSMSATPIPRTLYMSMVGGKDISLVNTPPKNRTSIKTQVIYDDVPIMQEAIEKELNRNGQVFFIHNRVETIDSVAAKVRTWVPNAKVGVAHGQMHPHELERVMHAFIHNEVNVLVSTTIVESGIDIPNANTIFINRAECFGLSELYQLKGRVGRYDREAYAFLVIPKNIALSHDAQERLDAIEKHSHLGAGFNIAMKDLEIRGAGNLLGTQQSGYISSIGFDLYCRLLKDAIDSLSSKN